jgi:hypothetical protein
MVEAGEAVWLEWQEKGDYSTERLVRNIYLAMKAAQTKSHYP